MNKKIKNHKCKQKITLYYVHAHLQRVKILSLAIRAKSVHKNKIISKTSHSENKVHTPLHVNLMYLKVPDNHLL